MKSFKRLGVDPLTVYGTLCVKCPISDPTLAAAECVERIVEEIAIVGPRLIVAMGDDALDALSEVEVPLSRPLEPKLGEVQPFTPTIEVLFVPEIDQSLDSEESKREFWNAFRVLGDWYADLPAASRRLLRREVRSDRYARRSHAGSELDQPGSRRPRSRPGLPWPRGWRSARPADDGDVEGGERRRAGAGRAAEPGSATPTVPGLLAEALEVV